MSRQLKNLWQSSVRRVRDEVEDVQSDMERSGPVWRIGLLLLLAYGLVAFATGIYWSISPKLVHPSNSIQRILHQENVDPSIAGATTTASLIYVVETLWQKPGGYLYNDLTPPGVWLDDMPHWEYGVIIQVRDMCKAMRESFSRSQSQSREDPDLQKAESRFNFNHDSWLIPSTESQYQEGAVYLRAYLGHLGESNARDTHFYARADNLAFWLATVETRLGDLSQRLSASVGQARLKSTLSNKTNEIVKTPWRELDDIFYEARGSAWALIQILNAVEVDFAEVLQDKNALVSVQQILRELESTQQPLYSPAVLNGSGFGLLANHSLVMASYISRANAAIIDLRRLLERG